MGWLFNRCKHEYVPVKYAPPGFFQGMGNEYNICLKCYHGYVINHVMQVAMGIRAKTMKKIYRIDDRKITAYLPKNISTEEAYNIEYGEEYI